MVHHLEAWVHQDLGRNNGEVLYKYYPSEDKVTFQNLQMVRQRPREDPVQFIKRFKDVSLDCYGDHEKKELVETCISNMIFDYRLNLENLCVT